MAKVYGDVIIKNVILFINHIMKVTCNALPQMIVIRILM